MYKTILSLFLYLALATAGMAQERYIRADSAATKLFNPDISVVVDGIYYNHSGDESMAHILEALPGFGHGHGPGEEHDHDHAHGLEKGFNLRHLELMLQADVDPYFKGWATVAVDTHGAELEEAVIQTTGLPWGTQVKLGKFFSDFTRINAQHAHSWNFTDAPLIHQVFFGDHGINDKGVQLSWLAPTPFFLQFGAEAFQGDNEAAFDYHGEEPLPEHAGPRVGVGWVKLAPNLAGPHAMQLGAFAVWGRHQEEHPGPTGHDDPGSHFLDGHQAFWGGDLVYKYTPPRAYGHGHFVLECGYIGREKKLELVAHNDPDRAGLIGNHLVQDQDGCYLQGIYGFAPRWRIGLRAEAIGLVNRQTKPDGARDTFDTSYRGSGMLDWSLTEYSRLRLQANHGRYALEDGRESITEVFLQAVFTLGAHPAHAF